MNSLFDQNSYKILGLETSSTQRDITRRAKELEKLIQIDEEPTYDNDLPIVENKRTLSQVKDAHKKLTTPNKRVSEYFFWFEISDSSDENALAAIMRSNFEKAKTLWEKRATDESAKGYMAKKNLAVLLSLMAGADEGSENLNESVRLWHEISQSDKFWVSFSKVYLLNDDIGSSADVIDAFRSSMPSILSDYYTSLSKKFSNKDYISAFSSVFAVKGKQTERDVIDPLFNSINDTSKQLSDLEITSEKVVDEKQLNGIRKLVHSLQRDFNELKELGYYEDSTTKTMRDKAAMSIRSVYLDLYNNLNESGKSLSLLKVALDICGTSSVTNRLNQDKHDLTKLIANEKIIKPINVLLEDEKFSEALELIDTEKSKHSKNKELQQYFNNRTQWCVTSIASKEFLEAKSLYDRNKFSDAQKKYISVKDYILSYIQFFNFNQKGLQELLDEATRIASTITQNNLQSIDDYRNKIIKSAEETFGENFEQTILIILVDSIIWSNLSALVPKVKRNSRVSTWFVSGVIGFFILVSLISGASNNNSSGTNGGSGGTTSQSCLDQEATLKSQVDNINSQMASDQASGNTDAYNALVDQHNTLADQYNALLKQCGNGQ